MEVVAGLVAVEIEHLQEELRDEQVNQVVYHFLMGQGDGYRRLIAVVQSGQFEVVGLELVHALGGFEEAHQVCDDALIDFSSYNE